MQASGGEDVDVVAIETTPSQIHVNSSSPRWYSNPNITDAQLLSQISCIMTFSAAIVGFALYESTASPAMLAFSLEVSLCTMEIFFSVYCRTTTMIITSSFLVISLIVTFNALRVHLIL